MNEGRSDREAEHMQRMDFYPELIISSLVIEEQEKPLTNQHFIVNCLPLNSLPFFQSPQRYHTVINVELHSTMGISCLYCPASILLFSKNKPILYMKKTPCSVLVPVI